MEEQALSLEDQFKVKALEWLNDMESIAKQGGDFVVEHAPETVQQYLQFNFVISCVYSAIFATFILILLTCIVVIWRVTKDYNDLNGDRSVARLFGTGIPLGAILIIGTHFMHHLTTALKIHFAPNVYILEELARLIK